MGESDRDNVRHLVAKAPALSGLQEWILSEHLHAGDELPPERDLARSLGVGTVSLRKAVRVLESLGVVEPGPDGAVIATASSIALDTLLRLHISLSGFRCTDLMSTRIELERSSAARAATEAMPEDLERLRSVVETMASPAIDRTRFRELDCEFHLGLARAARNELVAILLAALGDAVKNAMSDGYARCASWPNTVSRLAAEHHWILDCVAGGHPRRAADEISRHITDFYNLHTG